MELTHDGDEQGEDHLDQDYDVLSDDLLQNAPDPIQPPNGSCHKSTAPLQPFATPNPKPSQAKPDFLVSVSDLVP